MNRNVSPHELVHLHRKDKKKSLVGESSIEREYKEKQSFVLLKMLPYHQVNVNEYERGEHTATLLNVYRLNNA